MDDSKTGRAPGKVTIYDVADRAGVSASTVSRVLSNRRPTGAAVAAKVRAIAAELDFRPDFAAQALRLRTTNTIGLVVPNITNPFFPSLVQALEQSFRRRGVGVLLMDAEDSPMVERSCVETLLGRQVEALLISPCDRKASRATVSTAAEHLPTLQIDRRAVASASFVGVKQTEALTSVIAHLKGSGKTCLAFVGSDPAVATSWERQQAFQRYAKRSDPSASDRILVGSFSVGWGRQAAAEILDTWPKVDAIVCASDLIATGVLAECHDRGIALPERLAVTGWDDTLLAGLARPTLTSVAQPVAQIAEAALGVLAGVHLDLRLPATLVVRASSDRSASLVTSSR